MQVYKYDEQTKEYIGTEQALIDPLETELQGKEIYLLPANATFEKPNLQDGFASVWHDKWENIEDNRGKEYWLDTDTFGTPAREMKELGAFPANAVFTAPTKTLEELKAQKLAQVDAWTANKIIGGFISSASGEPVRYDSDKDTQITMQGIALNVNSNLFAEKYPNGCPVRGYAENSDTKSIFMLTAEQVLQWCADLSIHIGTCKQEGWAKQAEVNACTTKEELEAIVLDKEVIENTYDKENINSGEV